MKLFLSVLNIAFLHDIIGNVVHLQWHQVTMFTHYHSKKYFYIGLFQLEAYELKSLVLLQLVVLLGSLPKDNFRNHSPPRLS